MGANGVIAAGVGVGDNSGEVCRVSGESDRIIFSEADMSVVFSTSVSTTGISLISRSFGSGGVVGSLSFSGSNSSVYLGMVESILSKIGRSTVSIWEREGVDNTLSSLVVLFVVYNAV